MVIYAVQAEGVEKPVTLSMDNKLHRELTTKVQPNIQEKDTDWVVIVDGMEGSGKSVLAMQIGKTLDPSLSLDRVCFTADQFARAVVKAKKGQCVIFDEAFVGLSSKSSLSAVNKVLVQLLMECRQQNLVLVIVMPTIFMLERYVALFRAKGLFHVYTKKGQRGFWHFYNIRKKKLLYIKGKQFFSYSQPRSGFRGRFNNTYIVSERLYREKKKRTLHNSILGADDEDNIYKEQRDRTFYFLYKVLGFTGRDLSIVLDHMGVKLTQQAISYTIKGISPKIAPTRPPQALKSGDRY